MSTDTETDLTPPALEPVKSRTEAEEKLWQALLGNPGSTAATLSITAGIGKSTAPKILARWEKDGLVSRTAGNIDGGKRPADHWSITFDDRLSDEGRSADDGPTDAQPTRDQPVSGEDVLAVDQPATAEAQAGAEPKGERLAPGALRGMVEDHLREHSGREFTPTAMGKALTRSAGAVHNALEKLVAGGYAVRTNDKPKKYALAPTADDGSASH